MYTVGSAAIYTTASLPYTSHVIPKKACVA